MNSVHDCLLTALPQEEDPRGSLTYVYGGRHVPFAVRRVFWIYDVPAGKDRGAHAHRECWQAIVAASGALEVYLYDGHEERTVRLDRPFQALVVPPGIWAQEREFTTGAVCLVLASHDYDASDYIRSLDDYNAIYGR